MGEGVDWSPRSSRKYACTEVYTKKAGRRCYTYHLHFECWNYMIEILLARIHTYVLHTANNKDMCNTYCPLKECIVCRPADIIHGAAGARREDGGERTGSAERTRTMLWRRRRRRRRRRHGKRLIVGFHILPPITCPRSPRGLKLQFARKIKGCVWEKKPNEGESGSIHNLVLILSPSVFSSAENEKR